MDLCEQKNIITKVWKSTQIFLSGLLLHFFFSFSVTSTISHQQFHLLGYNVKMLKGIEKEKKLECFCYNFEFLPREIFFFLNSFSSKERKINKIEPENRAHPLVRVETRHDAKLSGFETFCLIPRLYVWMFCATKAKKEALMNAFVAPT